MDKDAAKLEKSTNNAETPPDPTLYALEKKIKKHNTVTIYKHNQPEEWIKRTGLKYKAKSNPCHRFSLLDPFGIHNKASHSS